MSCYSCGCPQLLSVRWDFPISPGVGKSLKNGGQTFSEKGEPAVFCVKMGFGRACKKLTVRLFVLLYDQISTRGIIKSDK
jgi:hypothetical protein